MEIIKQNSVEKVYIIQPIVDEKISKEEHAEAVSLIESAGAL